MRILAILLAVIPVACLGMGIYSYLQEPSEEGPALIVHEPERDLGTIQVGQEYEVEFHIDNRSAQEWRIVGAPPS